MKYRIKPSSVPIPKREKRLYRRVGRNSSYRFYGYRADEIDLAALFEISKLDTPDKATSGRKKKRRQGVLKRLSARARVLAGRVGDLFFSVGQRIIVWLAERREKRRSRPVPPSALPMLSGALVATLLVGAFSGAAILYKLVLSNYFGVYKKVSIPSLVGQDYSVLSGTLSDEIYKININYEYSDTVPYGRVISQYPYGGVERKIYLGGEPCELSITLSRGERVLSMPDVVGASLRDATLMLRNYGVPITVVEEYSDTAPVGRIISSSPLAQESFYAGQGAVLHVSLGKEKHYVRVPDICGLSEASAQALLREAGLLLGEVRYSTSSYPAGTVISQSCAFGSELERGQTVSVVVSAGQQFGERGVPSLYGLTLDEARRILREYGLICGNIYTVASSEASGTVVAQSPTAGSVITPSRLTVDIYVSS